MVMDENGRNGWKWHLAQQLAQPVIRYVLSSTTNPIPCDHDYHNKYGVGVIFIFLISIKNFPPYAIIIIYNLLTNRWLEYGIIRWY